MSVLKTRTELLDESSGSGAESQPQRRFQRVVSENQDPSQHAMMPPGAERPMLPANDLGSIHSKRRSTLRDSKPVLLGPRPMDQSKRVISDSSYLKSSNLNPSYADTFARPMLSQSTTSLHNEGHAGTLLSAPHAHAGFLGMNGSSEFLPSVNFDDFHASISGLNGFSLLSSTGSNELSASSMSDSSISQQPSHIQQSAQSNAHVKRSGSLIRRPSNARKPVNGQQQSQGSRDINAMPPPAAPAAGRGRRQSAFTTSLVQATAQTGPRQPRKSVGPGFAAQQGASSRSSSRDASANPSQRTQTNLVRSNSNSRSAFPPSQIPSGSRSSIILPSRAGRIKSLQPPPRGQTHSNMLSSDPQTQSNDGANAYLSPRPRMSGRNTPPSSGNSSKRLSTVHVGGLGARTISPTDARRLRRLSQVPKQPVMPQLPVTTPTEISRPRQGSYSPAAIVAPKTWTPSSSSRNTPEFSRKAVNNNNQMPAVPNFSSIRPVGQAGSRNSQVLAASRLPTAKSRNVHSSNGFVEEEVPPVPAIPKAYESPKDVVHDHASYFTRKPVESADYHSQAPPAPTNAPPAPPIDDDSHDQFVANQRHRRGLTVGSGSGPDKQQAGHLNKKNLQPLRLPPLNLLPLSDTASSRISTLPPPSADFDARYASTPPPRRNVTKTPSTPLTASRATFFPSTFGDDNDEFRSSSSHQPTRPNGFDMQFPQFGLSAPIPIAGSRNNASPFASNSLPKLGDFGSFSATPVAITPVEGTFGSTPFLLTNEPEEMNLPSPGIVPAAAVAGGATQNSSRTSNSDEPPTPASTTSLRRKLSLTWKRSSSKASQRAAEKQAEKDEAKSKQTEMPPPKIPAASTWTARTSSDAGSTRTSFDTKTRKGSNNAPLVQASRSTPQHSHQSSDSGAVKPIEPQLQTHPNEQQRRPVPRSTSASILTPVQRILGAKAPMNTLRSRNLDTNLDKDDLAADKVMEKLASKRRDFENAAKEVDELRRRAHPKDRVSPAQAIQMVNLNIFERGEIVDFKEIYFCGTRNAKKITGNADHASTNFGYDDDRGDYNIILGDHLSYRYEVVDVLGKGSFGQVVRCIDHKTGGLVAIKIIRNKKRFHQQALVEVNILQKLRDWDPENRHSMISFTQSFYFRGHLCISTELLGINLYEFIKAYDFKGFPLVLIRRFAKQILSSLVLLKSKRVIHCDLKPENILLAHPMHSEIKVIDFGSSCFENEKVYTYIQSRFYRSPEVILGMSYGIPIDMWSLGCILAELLTGYPIFPGENEQEQLACIMEIFGPPEKHLVEKSSRKKLFFDSMGKPRVTVSSKGRRRRPSSKTLQSALKCDDDAFLDFLTLCLRWDPEKRLRPEHAMQHEFVTGIKRAPGPQRPIARAPINPVPPVQSSPVKRFNAPNPTPHRAQGSREQPGTVRPLPDPQAPGLRNISLTNASPVKPNQATNRRHSIMVPTPGSGPIGPQKRVHTTTGSGNAVSGLTGVIAAGNRQSQMQPPQPQPQGQSQARVMSGRGDLASAAAAISLRSGAR